MRISAVLAFLHLSTILFFLFLFYFFPSLLRIVSKNTGIPREATTDITNHQVFAAVLNPAVSKEE